jgi:hypothetical protein
VLVAMLMAGAVADARGQGAAPDTTLPRPVGRVARDTTVIAPRDASRATRADTSRVDLPGGAAAERDSLARTGHPPEAGRAARTDTATVPAPEPPRPRRSRPEVPTLDQPRWVMLRSLVAPGWGQLHNQSWIKGALVAGADGYLRVQWFKDERRLNDLNRDAIAKQADFEAAVADTAAAGAAYRAALAGGDPQEIAAAEAALQAAQIRMRAASDVYNQAASLYNALLDASTNRRWLMAGVILYALLDAYVDAHFRTFAVDFSVDPALGGSRLPGMRMALRWSF